MKNLELMTQRIISQPIAASVRLRVLIADDHPLVREGIRAALQLRQDVQVVGHASNGEEAVALAQKLKPDVVVMDISMPKVDGFEATRRMRAAAPGLQVVILSVHESSEYVAEVVRAGARAYVLKESAVPELLQALDAVRRGGDFFSPKVSGALAQSLRQTFTGRRGWDARLSAREREVLGLIAQGLLNKQIADRLGVGVNTAITYRRRLMKKLGINNVAGLTRFAIHSGVSGLLNCGQTA